MRISTTQAVSEPDISKNLVVYFGVDGVTSNPGQNVIYVNQGIFVYDKTTHQTYKVATPSLTGTFVQYSHPKIAGNLIVWDDNLGNNWEIFACTYDPVTHACPAHQLTHDAATQYVPDVTENGFIVWDDWRNDALNPTYGNRDIYGCVYDPATGACPERQITSQNRNQILPKVSDYRVVWIDNRNGNAHQDIYTCVFDPATGACPETYISPIPTTGIWESPRVSHDRVVAILRSSGDFDPTRLPVGLYQLDPVHPENPPVQLNGLTSDVDIDGSLVVWASLTDMVNFKNFDIRAKDLETGQLTQLTLSPVNDTKPTVSKGCIAYLGTATGSSQVYLTETLCPPQAPVLQQVPDMTGAEASPLAVNLRATNPDEQPVTYGLTPLPTGAAFDPATGVLTWTPSYTQAGAYALTGTATDPTTNLSASCAFTITIANTNRAPVLAAIADKTVQEGQALTFTVTATDPDGDAVTFDATAAGPLPSGVLLDGATGVFTWTPDIGQAAQYILPITASDGSLSGLGSVTITVTPAPVNQAPVLSPVAGQTLDEGAPMSMTITASDPDGDALTYTATGMPVGATLDPATGVLTWTPTYEQAGTYPLTVTAADPAGLSASQTFTLTVANINRPPVMAAIPDKTVQEGHQLTFTVTATDPDGDPVTFTASAAGPLPAGATLDPAAGVFSWTPSVGQAGRYVIPITASDASSSNMESVTITVTSLNQPPVLDPIGFRSVAEAQTLTFTISGSDPDGDALTYSTANLPVTATFDPATRTFSWTPTYASAGAYPVTFSASDGKATTSETISISVLDVPMGISTFTKSADPFGPDGIRTVLFSGLLYHAGTWQIALVSPAGVTVRTLTGSGSSISAVWDGKNSAGAIVADGTYAIQVTAIDAGNGTAQWSGTIKVDATRPTITAISDSPDPMKVKVQSSTIKFTLSEPAFVSVTIVNKAGKLVQSTVYKQWMAMPQQTVVWNGKNNAGTYVAPATYTYQITATDAAGNNSTPFPITGTIDVRK